MFTIHESVGAVPSPTLPPPVLPRAMAWLLAACLMALATLPWAIPVLLMRIIKGS